MKAEGADVADGPAGNFKFPAVMVGVAWHPTKHVVAVCAATAAHPVVLLTA